MPIMHLSWQKVINNVFKLFLRSAESLKLLEFVPVLRYPDEKSRPLRPGLNTPVSALNGIRKMNLLKPKKLGS